jgi:hypothetical protein
VRFEVALQDDALAAVHRCDCSFCRMRGAVTIGVPQTALRITQGEDALTEYRFNTGTARHYFCSGCGIYTHHRRRSNPTEFGVNVACLEGVSPFDFHRVPVGDGVHHPSDTGAAPRLAGVLTYEAFEDESGG